MINPEVSKLMMTSLFDEAKNDPNLALIILRHMNDVLSRVDLVLPSKLELNRTEMKLVLERKKIHAIKEVRNRTGLGLKESKDLVDAWDTEVVPFHLKSINPPLEVNQYTPSKIHDSYREIDEKFDHKLNSDRTLHPDY